jgi:hypothetical protein
MLIHPCGTHSLDIRRAGAPADVPGSIRLQGGTLSRNAADLTFATNTSVNRLVHPAKAPKFRPASRA